jgi:hypothetical protein
MLRLSDRQLGRHLPPIAGARSPFLPQFRGDISLDKLRRETRMSKTFVILLPLLLIVPGPTAAQTPPTATEAFNLRIKCKQMADEKAEAVQSFPTNPATYELLEAFHSSNYDAKNNRCYIDIYRHLKTGRRKENDVTHRSIYDGQTDDMLVHTEITNGKKHGLIFDKSYKGQRFIKDGDASWEAAVTYMDELMADPIKQ